MKIDDCGKQEGRRALSLLSKDLNVRSLYQSLGSGTCLDTTRLPSSSCKDVNEKDVVTRCSRPDRYPTLLFSLHLEPSPFRCRPTTPTFYPPGSHAIVSRLPAMTQIITEGTRQRLQETDPRWRSKAILRMTAAFLDFVAMVLFVVSVTMTLHWEDVWNDGNGGDWTDGMPIAPVCAQYSSWTFASG